MALSNQDIAILVVIAAVGGAYLLYNNNNKKSTLSENTTSTISNGIKSGTQTPDTSYGRDFILAMEKAVSRVFQNLSSVLVDCSNLEESWWNKSNLIFFVEMKSYYREDH